MSTNDANAVPEQASQAPSNHSTHSGEQVSNPSSQLEIRPTHPPTAPYDLVSIDFFLTIFAF